MAKVPVDVFEYLDYRDFLRDYYSAKKAEGRGFSYRAFSRRAGLSSPNHLKRIMDGDRRLTPEMTLRYCKALGLEGEAQTYFVDLVEFSQARSAAKREAAYRRLAGSRGYRKAHRLDLAHAAYHSKWYLPAIREMVVRGDFREDPAWIARQLLPPISVKETKEALAILLELELLVRDDEGRLVQSQPVASTGPETRGLHIRAYHRAMMERAAEAMDTLGPGDRDVSSLTFCVGSEGLREIKERIQRFRKELIAQLATEVDGDQVLQLNMQLFPLTLPQSDDEEKGNA